MCTQTTSALQRSLTRAETRRPPHPHSCPRTSTPQLHPACAWALTAPSAHRALSARTPEPAGALDYRKQGWTRRATWSAGVRTRAPARHKRACEVASGRGAPTSDPIERSLVGARQVTTSGGRHFKTSGRQVTTSGDGQIHARQITTSGVRADTHAPNRSPACCAGEPVGQALREACAARSVSANAPSKLNLQAPPRHISTPIGFRAITFVETREPDGIATAGVGRRGPRGGPSGTK